MWWTIASIPSLLEPVEASELDEITQKWLSEINLDRTLPKHRLSVFKVVPHDASPCFYKVNSNMVVRGFHGSPFHNWLSILKHGLRIMSDHVEYRLHGRAHGSGIYVASTLRMAQKYAGHSEKRIVGIVDVVATDDARGFQGQSFWVVRDLQLIRLKYLLVWL